MVKNLPAKWETWVQSLGWEDPLKKGMAIHSRILAWRIPWIEKPGRLYSPWDCKESDTTECLTLLLSPDSQCQNQDGSQGVWSQNVYQTTPLLRCFSVKQTRDQISSVLLWHSGYWRNYICRWEYFLTVEQRISPVTQTQAGLEPLRGHLPAGSCQPRAGPESGLFLKSCALILPPTLSHHRAVALFVFIPEVLKKKFSEAKVSHKFVSYVCESASVLYLSSVVSDSTYMWYHMFVFLCPTYFT